ncbi:MAG: type IV secretion system DNA-binding domain-containing protein, partial [Fimbriimonadales bacterium]|nr:type IV secretion system DNA-binding domain-containing protein [Fimbriimonadales bacterium]
MSQQPFVHLFRKSEGGWSGVCALRMTTCPMEREEKPDPNAVVKRQLRRQVDLINALYCPSPSRAYALRYLSCPHPASFAAGEMMVALFGKVEGESELMCREQARMLCYELGALLGGMMPNYTWRVVSDEEEFQRLWTPIAWDHAHLAEIRRREDRVSLETIRPRPMLGRGRPAPEPSQEAGEMVYFVHAFTPPATTLARLLRILLLQRVPILLQVGLAPVWLAPQEKDALVAELARAEQYLQQRDALTRQNTVATPTVLSQRATALCEGLLGQLLRLQDAPFLMHVLLASSEPIAPTVLEAAGVEMTCPVGEHSELASASLSGLQMGGYDVVVPSSPEERTVVLQNLQQIEFTPWGESLAPAPLRRARWLVDAHEASGAFRFPLATSEGLPGLEVQSARMRPVPREAAARWQQSLPETRMQIGESHYLGFNEPVFLHEHDRRQHVYIVGQTGTGKTTMLKTMITADMEAGRGLAVIDPHGDLFDELLTRIPPHRLDDVVILDPTDIAHPVGLNVLECALEQRYFVVREMRAIMQRLLEDQYGVSAAEFAGPVFYQHLQKSLLLVMSRPDDPGTLLEFYEIYQTEGFWRKWTPLQHPDPLLERWLKFLEHFDPTERYSEGLSWGEWISSKFEDFLLDPKLRLIFGQKRSTINLRQIMDEGK